MAAPAAVSSAVVQTFRSLSIASSNIATPAKTPKANPPPTPAKEPTTRYLRDSGRCCCGCRANEGTPAQITTKAMQQMDVNLISTSRNKCRMSNDRARGRISPSEADGGVFSGEFREASTRAAFRWCRNSRQLVIIVRPDLPTAEPRRGRQSGVEPRYSRICLCSKSPSAFITLPLHGRARRSEALAGHFAGRKIPRALNPGRGMPLSQAKGEC